MAILKLAVGTPITMTIADHEEVEGQFGTQVKFEGENGDCLFIGKDTAARQLERIGGAYPGDTLRFEKVAKGSKTFINIDQVNGKKVSGAKENGGRTTGAANAAAQPALAGTTSSTAAPGQSHAPETGHALYEKITAYVLKTIIPQYTKAGIAITHEGTAAIVATLYIAASRK